MRQIKPFTGLEKGTASARVQGTIGRAGGAVNRRSFLLGTAAAGLHAATLSASRAADVPLGSIDGSVSGNNFTAAQFLDYLASIKLTWAMISLPQAVLADEAALRQLRDHADRL